MKIDLFENGELFEVLSNKRFEKECGCIYKEDKVEVGYSISLIKKCKKCQDKSDKENDKIKKERDYQEILTKKKKEILERMAIKELKEEGKI